MPEIKPFRGLHYSERYLDSLGKLVCPPYDVLSDEQQRALAARHPVNFIRVEKPLGPAASKYAGAARIWKRWQDEGVIQRDFMPCFYVYEASFRSPFSGKPLTRRGFFAAVRTVPWGKGVHPHEKTLPTHKADRLSLFKAMKAQSSPIQCVFEDKGRAAAILDRVTRQAPRLDYKDGDGIRHRFWVLPEGEDARALAAHLARTPLVIADGHHRYETSRTFSQWARGRGLGESADYVMAYLCAVEDPGLEIHPTHRSVSDDKRQFVNLEKWGRLRPVKGLSALSPLIMGARRGKLEVGVFHNGKFYRYEMTPVPPSLRGSPSARLPVACLHAGALHGLGKEDFTFTQEPARAVANARRDKGWAFFLPPTDLRQVLKIATSGQVMPPKSTYFFPKIPSGLVAHALAGNI